MTTLELQRALLAHYNLAKQRVQEAETFEEAMFRIWGLRVQKGVCYCATEIFKERIGNEDWVKRNIGMSMVGYWGLGPRYATTKEQIIERLQLRIDILTKEINNHE